MPTIVPRWVPKLAELCERRRGSQRDRSAALIPDTMLSTAVALVIGALAVAIVALISERRARSAAQTAQARFLAMMEATGFGVLVVELSGRIVYGNNAAADILGYPVHALMKQNVYALLPGGAVDAPSASALRRSLGHEHPFVGQDHLVD